MLANSTPSLSTQAIASLVCCETERQMTWSRLEGLRFHWAVASGPKVRRAYVAARVQPPRAAPRLTLDSSIISYCRLPPAPLDLYM